MFVVRASKKAGKSALKMPEHYRKRISELIIALETNPVPTEFYDVGRMEGLVDHYRIRIGDIRIIYHISWDAKEIEILKIAWRGSAY